MSFSLSLSFFRLVVLLHLNKNLLRSKTLFVPGHLLLLILLPFMFGFVIIKADWTFRRTFLDEAFILLLLILLPLMFDSMMIKADRTFWRTFLDEAFIRNAKSFYQTSPTLTYSLSFTVGVGSHCVMSRSLVHPCLYRSSTPTFMNLIIHDLSLSLAFEVRASWSL